MDRGIEMTVIWFDDDLIELRVRASNGTFSGEADAYVSHSVSTDLARVLRGFPADINDGREFELGTFDPQCAGGGARFRFRCLDRKGHASVEVNLRADVHRLGAQSAIFLVPIEAAGVDAFADELTRMPLEIGARAVLRGAA